MTPALRFRDSTLRRGGRTIWSGLDLDVEPGEFLTVIGPNGAGKTSLLKVILGVLRAEGTVEVFGGAPRRGAGGIGYMPQRAALDPDLPMRARDLVALGVNGTRWGLGGGRAERERVDRALASVGAAGYAEAPVGRLSGGEQQRLRIAQALASEPRLLLCDEPLQNLDLNHQREVCDLLSRWSKESAGTVVFVTHDVNPVLRMTDRVLAVASGRWAAGPPGSVLTSATMTRLYGTEVEVVEVRGRVIVVADGFDVSGHHHHGEDGER